MAINITDDSMGFFALALGVVGVIAVFGWQGNIANELRLEKLKVDNAYAIEMYNLTNDTVKVTD